MKRHRNPGRGPWPVVAGAAARIADDAKAILIRADEK